MSGRLAGKVAIVTGGAVGIGRATCCVFAAQGAEVGVLDVDGEAARLAAEAIEADGGRALALEADVTRLDDAREAARRIEEAFGALDVLVNNAGVIGSGTVETTEEAEWHRVVSVNLTGVFLMSKAAIPALRRRGGGSIVNVSSAAGLAAWYDQAAYDASSEARNSAPAAISSGSEKRPSGICSSTRSRRYAASSPPARMKFSDIGVITCAGTRQLTRMPSRAKSSAMLRVRLTTPPFAAS